MQINDKKYYIYIIILGIILGYNFSAAAQDIKVDAKIDTTEFLIGDQVGIELSVKQLIGDFVGIPIFDQEMNKEIEVLEQSENDTTLIETGHYLIKKRVLITVFDSGYYALPPIPFLYYTDTIKTDPIIFKVATIPVDTSKAIKDIKMPYGAPLSVAEVLPWAGGGLGLTAIILVVLYIIRKLKRKEPILRRIKPKEPAHIIAYRDLEKLKEKKLWQKDLIKDYYTELTDILRLYLWNRYSIRTLERTSEEILESVKESEFKDELAYNELKDIFYISDLVKFAKFKPLVNDHEECMKNTYDIVDRTKLIVEENSENGTEIAQREDNKENKKVLQEETYN